MRESLESESSKFRAKVPNISSSIQSPCGVVTLFRGVQQFAKRARSVRVRVKYSASERPARGVKSCTISNAKSSWGEIERDDGTLTWKSTVVRPRRDTLSYENEQRVLASWWPAPGTMTGRLNVNPLGPGVLRSVSFWFCAERIKSVMMPVDSDGPLKLLAVAKDAV